MKHKNRKFSLFYGKSRISLENWRKRITFTREANWLTRKLIQPYCGPPYVASTMHKCLCIHLAKFLMLKIWMLITNHWAMFYRTFARLMAFFDAFAFIQFVHIIPLYAHAFAYSSHILRTQTAFIMFVANESCEMCIVGCELFGIVMLCCLCHKQDIKWYALCDVCGVPMLKWRIEYRWKNIANIIRFIVNDNIEKSHILLRD